MVSVSVYLDAEVVVKLDQERRWVRRSEAINKALKYILEQPGTVRNLCGADKIPPEYLT